MVMYEDMEYKYTYADLMAWDGPQYELIEGEPRMMAPPSGRHQEILGAMHAQIWSYLQGKSCKVFPAPYGVRLFEKEKDTPDEVDTMVEPDITVVCDPKKLDDAGCKGAPDMVAEILSASTRRHDKVTKFDLYQRAGVKEYWIVDPEIQVVQVYTLEKDRYHAATVYTREQSLPVGVLEGCSVDLNLVFTEGK